jgi:predicted permease
MWQDVRYALRGIRRAPNFAVVAALTLSLGIGANTAAFTFLNEVLLRPVPAAADAGRLVQLRRRPPLETKTSGFTASSYATYVWRARSFSGLLAYRDTDVNLSAGGRPERTSAAMVSGNYFSVLGLPMRAGRALGAEDDGIPGEHPVAVMSERLWKQRYGADPSVVGRRLTINGYPFALVGVSPEGFRGIEFGSETDLWVPLAMERQMRAGFDSAGFDILNVVGRLKPGVGVSQAQAEIGVLAAAIEETRPEGKARVLVISGVRLIPEFREYAVGLLTVLFATAALVMLIACTNMANLLLGRAAARRHEIAVRLALGGRRSRLIRLFLIESGILAMAGGALGLAVARVSSELMTRHFYTELGGTIALDFRVLAFITAAVMTSVLLFGLLPAFEASGQDMIIGLKDSIPGRRRLGLRNFVVVAQVALCMAAVISAGLFIRTLRNLRRVDLGFQTQRLFFVQLNLGVAGYSEVRGRKFYDELLERARRLATVQGATLADTMPPGWVWGGTVELEGSPLRKGESGIAVGSNIVGTEFFQTLRIPLLVGRTFQSTDRRSSAPVVVVNETMARRFWSGESPIGKRLRWTSQFGPGPYMQVVGVVHDGKYGALEEKTGPFVYLPFTQKFSADMKLVVRGKGQVSSTMKAVRDELLGLDPNLPIPTLDTMEQHIDEHLVNQRLVAVSTSIFGLIALALAGIGLYAVVSWSVVQRIREIGIRLALGAQPQEITRLILSDGLRLVAIGLGAGIVIAVVVTRAFTEWLFGVRPVDLFSYVAAGSLLIGVSLVASWVPARRVLRMDPVRSLRWE